MDLKDGAKQRLKHRASLVCSRKSKAILEQKSKKKQDGASLVAQLVKNLPEKWVQSLGWEDPLEKGKASHSSILGLKNSMDKGAWRTLQAQRVDAIEQLTLSLQ